jgi:uncharacterized iron-regulated protein
MHRLLGVALASILSGATVCAQAKPENATEAVVRAFETHDVVMFGEIHGNKQEYEWLQALVATPAFADRVDDIVLEFGNSLYQKSVDRYVAGEDIPLEQVQRAWRNTVGAIGPPSPVYGAFYQAVRESNLKRKGKHAMRIVCGDPYIDWGNVKDREDIGPYLAHRDEWYAEVVKEEVLAKHHRALLIMGAGHFLRRNGSGAVERQSREAGAKTYLIVAGTNTVGGYDDVDTRFDAWPPASIVSLADTWAGELAALPVFTGGTVGNVRSGAGSGAAGSNPAPPPLKLKDAADALFYLGPRDSLVQVFMARSELEGTPYGKEMERRLTLELGSPINFIPEKTEAPQYPRPQAGRPANAPPPLPPPPKSMNAPLPPRPPSQ